MTTEEKLDEIRKRYNIKVTTFEEYNDQGDMIHCLTSKDFRATGTTEYYDENNLLVLYKGINGFERRFDYDENYILVHSKDNDGSERWYNKKGRVYHFRNSNGYESWIDYDENGNKIHYKNSNGFEYWNEYDEKGKFVRIRRVE